LTSVTRSNVKWTSRALEALTVTQRTDFSDPDTKGLALRVTPRGTKTWTLLYNRKGDSKKRRITIGDFPDMGLADARAKAGELRGKVRAGQDPASAVAEHKTANTVIELLDLFILKHPRPDAAWTKECARLFKKDVEPVIGSIKLPNLTRPHVRQVLERVKSRGVTVAVNRTLAALRRAFSWGVSNDLMVMNPALNLVTEIEEKIKDRTLTSREVKDFWLGLDDASLSEGSRLALKLILATGQRPGEVCGARKSEVDLATRQWLIPAKRAKNRQAHVVPLTDLTVQLFEAALAIAGQGAFVFPGRSAGPVLSRKEKSVESHALSHAMRKCLPALGLKDTPATPHDLRRTAASHMARLGLPDRIVGRVLNHGTELRRTITSQVYIHHDYLPEKKQALDAWALELGKIISRHETESIVIALEVR
jgi:integrase